METFWYVAVTVVLAVFVVLDGFDFGVGIIYPFVARTEQERRMALASIGPMFNGNDPGPGSVPRWGDGLVPATYAPVTVLPGSKSAWLVGNNTPKGAK